VLVGTALVGLEGWFLVGFDGFAVRGEMVVGLVGHARSEEQYLGTGLNFFIRGVVCP
jgi:hypothetical protein